MKIEGSMIKVNEYFSGKVKSMAVQNSDGEQTVGVMKAGEYKFSTSKKEFMFVVSGQMDVKLPGESEFKNISKHGDFVVEANQSFDVVVKEDTIYLCRYE